MSFPVANPPFLATMPPKRAQAVVLAALLWTALPMAVFLPAGVIGLFILLFAGRVLLLRTAFTKLSTIWLMAMLVLAAALVYRQLGTLIGREGGISLLLLMVVVKSYESSTQRDWQVLLLSLLFLVGAGAVLNQSLLMGVWVLAALVGVSVAFAVLGGMDGRAALRFSLRSLLLTLPLAAVLFVAVPRRSEPLWRIPQPNTQQSQTGLSDTMEPGSISNLVQNNELVANVVFTGRQPKQSELYWRAIIMADYDGRQWHAVPEMLTDRAQPMQSGGEPLSYQMILRDQRGIIPVLDYLPEMPDGAYRMELGNVLRVWRSGEGLRRISLTATASDLLPQPLSRGEQRFYLQLPNTGSNQQTRMLAESFASQSHNTRDLVRRVLDYYRRQGFTYTLQPPKVAGADSIDRFMFETRQGFCEHYAQSFVVMMRMAGVPSRVVAGYLGGDYHENGKFWQIRNKDAHAWAEVWLPEEQAWWRVDPTAAISAARLQSNWQNTLPENERSRIRTEQYWGYQWVQSGQFYWQQWVVNFDSNKQEQLFAGLGLGSFRHGGFVWVLVLGGAVALLPVWLWWRNGRREETDPLQEGFMLLKSTVLAGEYEELAAVSASELIELMHANGIRAPQIEQLLRRYERWCYADDQLPPPAEQRRWLKQAKAAAKAFQAAER